MVETTVAIESDRNRPAPGSANGPLTPIAVTACCCDSATEAQAPTRAALIAMLGGQLLSAGAPLRVGGQLTPPSLVSQPRPIYPPAARAAGIEGRVVVQAVIGADGGLFLPCLASGGQVDPQLVQAALGAVSQWHYRPTLLNGDPVETNTTITVSFCAQRLAVGAHRMPRERIMNNHAGEPRNERRQLFWRRQWRWRSPHWLSWVHADTAATGPSSGSRWRLRAPTPAMEIDAGGKMAFDVASASGRTN